MADKKRATKEQIAAYKTATAKAEKKPHAHDYGAGKKYDKSGAWNTCKTCNSKVRTVQKGKK